MFIPLFKSWEKGQLSIQNNRGIVIYLEITYKEVLYLEDGIFNIIYKSKYCKQFLFSLIMGCLNQGFSAWALVTF